MIINKSKAGNLTVFYAPGTARPAGLKIRCRACLKFVAFAFGDRIATDIMIEGSERMCPGCGFRACRHYEEVK